MATAINVAAMPRLTVVPIPPSKTRTHPEYDPRMSMIARAISSELQVRELIILTADRDAAHESANRLKPDELEALLAIDEACAEPPPTEIILIDDVLTTGCGFVACRSLLHKRFGPIPVHGIFAARRALEDECPFPPIEL